MCDCNALSPRLLFRSKPLLPRYSQHFTTISFTHQIWHCIPIHGQRDLASIDRLPELKSDLGVKISYDYPFLQFFLQGLSCYHLWQIRELISARQIKTTIQGCSVVFAFFGDHLALPGIIFGRPVEHTSTHIHTHRKRERKKKKERERKNRQAASFTCNGSETNFFKV